MLALCTMHYTARWWIWILWGTFLQLFERASSLFVGSGDGYLLAVSLCYHSAAFRGLQHSHLTGLLPGLVNSVPWHQQVNSEKPGFFSKKSDFRVQQNSFKKVTHPNPMPMSVRWHNIFIVPPPKPVAWFNHALTYCFPLHTLRMTSWHTLFKILICWMVVYCRSLE